MNDIFDGLAQVRRVFLRHELKPPTVMLLESHEEGMRFLREIRQSHTFKHRLTWVASMKPPDQGCVVEMSDGSAWMECRVMGIAVRWPANRYAMPDGSWSYA